MSTGDFRLRLLPSRSAIHVQKPRSSSRLRSASRHHRNYFDNAHQEADQLEPGEHVPDSRPKPPPKSVSSTVTFSGARPRTFAARSRAACGSDAGPNLRLAIDD